MTFSVFDIETTTAAQHKRKGSPFHPDNWVVAARVRDKDGDGERMYFGNDPRWSKDKTWFRRMLERSKVVVAFNGKFDVLHMIRDPANYKAWREFVARGGVLWDCQLGEYLLHGMAPQHHMLSLNEVAVRYGGTVKNDAIKALWDAGVNTPDIDPDMLMEYQDADVDNTYLIFVGQIAALRKRGGINSAMLNMGALAFTIEAEHNGMKIDTELAEKLRAELYGKLVECNERLAQYVTDLPFQFKWTSRTQLSALIFGGTVKYEVREPLFENGEPVYFQKKEEHVVLKDGSTKPGDQVTDWEWGTEVARFGSGKKAGEVKTKQVTVPDIERGQKTRIVEKEYTFPGYVLPRKEWESSTPGVYSTKSEIIAELGETSDVPFIKDMAANAKMSKDLGTYYWTEKDGERKGMLTLVGDDGIVHHSLNMVNTVTGRLSSSDPNLQNIPKGDKSDIKSVFVSRFDDGYIVQSDFTSLEIYMQAVLTMCRQLIEDLRAGLDMHCARAETAWGAAEERTYEQILAAAKDENHPEHKKWKKKRNNAKVFSFQRAYGAGVAKIAQTTGMPVEDVEALVLAESKRYPEIDKFYEELHKTLLQNRKPTAVFVNHPDFPTRSVQLGKSHYTTPDGKVYSYIEDPAPRWVVERGGGLSTFSPTEERNYVVQGLGGEWAKAAMWLTVRAFYSLDNFGGMACVVNQVHDAEYIDAHASVVVKAAAMQHACLLEASTFMEYWFKWTLPLSVPAETKYGRSMLEEHDLPEGFSSAVVEAREYVRTNFINKHIPSWEQENS